MYAHRNPAVENLGRITTTRQQQWVSRTKHASLKGSPYRTYDQNRLKAEVSRFSGFGVANSGLAAVKELPAPNYLEQQDLANLDMLTIMSSSEKQVRAKLIEANERISFLEQQLAGKTGELKPLTQALDALISLNQPIPDEVSGKIQSLQEDISLLRTELDTLSAEASTYHTMLEQTRNDIAGVAGDLGLTDNDIHNDYDVVPDWLKTAGGAVAMLSLLVLYAGFRGKRAAPRPFQRGGNAYNVLMPGV
jgi:hypothetical protein